MQNALGKSCVERWFGGGWFQRNGAEDNRGTDDDQQVRSFVECNACSNCAVRGSAALALNIELTMVRAFSIGFTTAGNHASVGMRAITLISKSKPASQLTPIAVQFG